MQWSGTGKISEDWTTSWLVNVYIAASPCTGIWLVQRNKIGRTCHAKMS